MNFIIQKLKSKHTSLKKYTNWARLTEQNYIHFLSFRGNERRKKQIFRILDNEDEGYQFFAWNFKEFKNLQVMYRMGSNSLWKCIWNYTGDPRLMQISLLQFFKTLQIFRNCDIWLILFHYFVIRKIAVMK